MNPKYSFLIKGITGFTFSDAATIDIIFIYRTLINLQFAQTLKDVIFTDDTSRNLIVKLTTDRYYFICSIKHHGHLCSYVGGGVSRRGRLYINYIIQNTTLITPLIPLTPLIP